jgi:hypothetical protein
MGWWRWIGIFSDICAMAWKKLLWIGVLGFLLIACQKASDDAMAASEKPANKNDAAPSENVAQKSTSEKLTRIEWYQTEHDFGPIMEGEKATYRFKFKNTGQEPLILKKVKPSCGCTTPDYSKDPIAPGEEGYIDVTYDSDGRPGQFNKSVTVETNTEPSIHILRITGEVTPKSK